MILADERRREIGIRHLSRIKEMFGTRKNIAQETFDSQPPHIRKTICFHAGLKSRHLMMKFSEMNYTERQQVVAALNSLIGLTESLPKFISEDDCKINTNH
ncbi:MAG: hypothetical protein P4L95_09295 [Rouxiella aceris]|uniref:hypothetical protein n=1 Tax=Rouxiella aceris TaxID=2703884 RepID=UPI00284C0D00|nr:hypothetical protein [Rouxiella aceris]MDR3432079.1 hypothetical protein [Rouxiella aceris]